MCYDKIEEILKKNKNVIIAGGTGLYINAVVYNMNFENGMHALTEYGTDILRTESSKNSIYDEDVFS